MDPTRKPIFELFDFSGDKAGFGEVMTAIEAAEQALVTPKAQRSGSLADEKAARPPLPFSAALGARKPLANEPRTANSLTGFHFKPTFGV